MSQEPTLRPDFLIDDEAELRRLFPPTHAVALKKSIDHLDRHALDFVSKSPFLCIGTQSPDGTADVSPRGDPPGFVGVLDPRTLLIPDRPGNNRLDTLSNIVRNPVVGLIFMVPGFDETLRVNGTARLTRDPDLLAPLAVNDRVPTLAIVVSIQEVFLHCAKAFRRGKVWDPSTHQDRKSMPPLLQMISEQTGAPAKMPDDIAKEEADLQVDYQQSMY